MPKLYIAQERQRVGRSPLMRSPMISPGIGNTMNRLSAGQIRGGLRAPQVVAAVDKVGDAAVYKNIANTSTMLAKSMTAIADTEALLDAEEKRKELATYTNSILYEADNALFKQSGKVFLDQAKSVKQALRKKQTELASELESAAAFKFFDLTTSPLEATYGSIARAEVKALEEARTAAADRIVSDTALLLGRSSAKDIPGIIQTQAAAWVKAQGVEDPNAQVVMLRKFQEETFTSAIKNLLSSGQSSQEQLQNIDKAEQLVQLMTKAPGINPLQVDMLYNNIYAKRQQIQRQIFQEEFDIERLNALTQSRLQAAYETYLFDAKELGTTNDGRTLAQVVKDIKQDPTLDGATKQVLLDFASRPTEEEPTDPAFLASTVSLAMRSGSLYSDNAELLDRLKSINNPKDRRYIYSVLVSARDKNLKPTLERVFDDVTRAYYMLNGVKTPNKLMEQRAEQATAYIKSKIADHLARGAKTILPDGTPVDIPKLATALMQKYIPSLATSAAVPDLSSFETQQLPRKVKKFLQSLDQYSSFDEAYSAYLNLSWGKPSKNREANRRRFVLKTRVEEVLKKKLAEQFETSIDPQQVLNALGYGIMK